MVNIKNFGMTLMRIEPSMCDLANSESFDSTYAARVVHNFFTFMLQCI